MEGIRYEPLLLKRVREIEMKILRVAVSAQPDDGLDQSIAP
jgi:hypothetical protein